MSKVQAKTCTLTQRHGDCGFRIGLIVGLSRQSKIPDPQSSILALRFFVLMWLVVGEKQAQQVNRRRLFRFRLAALQQSHFPILLALAVLLLFQFAPDVAL